MGAHSEIMIESFNAEAMKKACKALRIDYNKLAAHYTKHLLVSKGLIAKGARIRKKKDGYQVTMKPV